MTTNFLKSPKIISHVLALSLALGCSGASEQSGNDQTNSKPKFADNSEDSRGTSGGKKKTKNTAKDPDDDQNPDDDNSQGDDGGSEDGGTTDSPNQTGSTPSDKNPPPSGGEANGTSSADFVGFVTGSHKEGTIYGYALMRNDNNAVAKVSAYLGGPRNAGGKKIGEAVADKSGFAGGFQGNHAFRLSVTPELYENGQSFQVHLYEVGGSELQNSPITVMAYRPKGAALFEQNKAGFNACVGCHGDPDYSAWFDRLVSPPPGQGGSATGNNLYRRASGNGHPAGNFCGGGNFCNFLSQWWTTEFGN